MKFKYVHSDALNLLTDHIFKAIIPDTIVKVKFVQFLPTTCQ